MPVTRVGLSIVVLIVCTACSSSSGSTQPQAAGGSSPPAPSACPVPAQPGATFPRGASAEVPHPAFAQSPHYLRVTVKGEHTLQFTTAMSLRDAAEFVQQHYPVAGYRTVGGDAERTEADIVWVHGNYSGRTRLSAVTSCSTTWTVLAVPPGARVPEGH